MEQVGQFKSWTQRYPNALAVVVACAIFVFVLAFGPTTHPVTRALFAAALVMMSAGALESAQLGAGSVRLGNLNRWALASIHMAYLSVFMMIFTVQDFSASWPVMIGPLIGGAIYGVLTAFVLPTRDTGGSTHHYDLSRSVAQRPLSLWLWRVFPVSALALVTGLFAYPPVQGWEPQYLMFQAVLLPFVLFYAPPAKGLPFWQSPLVLRLAAIATLLAGLFLT